MKNKRRWIAPGRRAEWISWTRDCPPILTTLPYAEQRRWAPLFLRGLLLCPVSAKACNPGGRQAFGWRQRVIDSVSNQDDCLGHLLIITAGVCGPTSGQRSRASPAVPSSLPATALEIIVVETRGCSKAVARKFAFVGIGRETVSQQPFRSKCWRISGIVYMW